MAEEEAPPVPSHLPPPFIYLPNLANLRDAGGLAAKTPNSAVRTRHIYRSADPSLCTTQEIKYMRETLGIEHIFDLRSGPEFEKQGLEVVEGFDERVKSYSVGKSGTSKIYRHWTPAFKNEDYSPESIALRFRDYGAADSGGFVRAYEQVLLHAGPSYAKILRQLGKKESGGVLLHCTAGKDRTGVIVAIILTLLGVPKSEICQEYQLTETGLQYRRPQLLEKLLATGAFEGEDGKAMAMRMSGARAESMNGTLELIEQKWGSVIGYVKDECGLSDDEIEALRVNLTVPAATMKAGGVTKFSVLAVRAVL